MQNGIDFQTVYNAFFFSFAMALLPMLSVAATSFVKLSVVFSLLRNALGIQQIPSNLVIYTFALILTGFIMAPTLDEILIITREADLQDKAYFDIIPEIVAPLTGFMERHVRADHLAFFQDNAAGVWNTVGQTEYSGLFDFVVLLPAFMTSEIVAAFEVGFLLYLPFLAIDLIVSNVLLSLGMMMLSPVTISLPFKLLLFVAVNGWTLLVRALVLSYS